MILGIDEVGRGPWAGPLVVGAVVLPEGLVLEGLTDSKKVSAKKRQLLDIEIREKALGWGLGWVHADELDKIGLSEALRRATIRAVEAVATPYHEIIIDGTINFLKETSKGRYVTTMAKADFLVPAVSAASIVAKVARDAYMDAQDKTYPEYGFASHVGYGTAKHQQALETFGVTPLHRRSFAPIAKLLGEPTESTLRTNRPTTKAIGDKAETRVANWLVAKGFVIIERNWKTKYCEIDIIAEMADTRYFIEVKYRSSKSQGGGIEAITAKKLEQMRFAAELYTARYTTSKQQKLAVVSLGGGNEGELVEVE
ncbi:MAG TPA: ribonuclease HII [Dongiaceae bacterium]|nr:ribonuclease HII [Dongiaceae bacterium]